MTVARGPWQPGGSKQTAEDPAAPDQELVRRSLAGDAEAYAELVRRYQRPLMAKALSSTRNVADADDMVQETFTRAWTNLSRCRDAERFGAWLHRILANLLVDRSRRAWREIPVEDSVLDTAAEQPGPEGLALASELLASVNKALDSLPAGRQREVFRLRYAEGLQIDEIASRLGVHSGTIKVHLFRTMKKLKQVLGPAETVL